MMEACPRLGRLACTGALVFTVLCTPWTVLGGEAAPKNDVTKAEHYMVKLEQEVARYGGKPFKPRYDGQEALRRVKALKSRYPDDPAVEALFQRARKALMATKGNIVEITPAMLAYRDNEKKLTRTIAELADKEWQLRMEEWKSTGALLAKSFPAPEPLKTSPDSMLGRVVVLEDFAYPTNEFTDTGGQFVFVGSGTRGYYYVQLSSRAWLGAYEALKRYKRSVNSELAEGWTVAGTITGVTLLVPQAGKKKTMNAMWGWVVTPIAIYVPGRAAAWAAPDLEKGGVFAGEFRFPELKAATYTFNEVPKDVEPLELVEIFATAIKEKHWRLFLECLDPARQKTPTAISRLRYFYDNNLERYRTLYVYVHPEKVAWVKVLKGEDDGPGTYEDFFLSDDQRTNVNQHADEKVEEAAVIVSPYNERGKQVMLPKKVKLRRYTGGRWYISEGYPL